ncbi:MAG: hypothetical protein ACK4PN_07530 [Allorhizobium sp.]
MRTDTSKSRPPFKRQGASGTVSAHSVGNPLNDGRRQTAAGRFGVSISALRGISVILQSLVTFSDFFVFAVLTCRWGWIYNPLTERGRRRCWRRSLSFFENLKKLAEMLMDFLALGLGMWFCDGFWGRLFFDN